jgi:hypothetical protein
MNVLERKRRWAGMGTVFSLVLVMGGCATAIKYTFDLKASFAEQKSYAWAPSMSPNQVGLLESRAGRLLESNVQVLADQLLAQKGFNKVTDKPDLEMMIGFVSNHYGDDDHYQIQELTLSIYGADKKELVWRGSAFGTIDIDAASDDLKRAVQGILSNFPPKHQ